MKILFISLGCDKNLVDSEKMLGLLRGEGYEIIDEESQADVIVVNSCCFINDAKEESIETILEMAEWKKKGNLKALVVTGCLAQRYRKEIRKEIPEVDAIVGTTGYEKIAEAIEEAIHGKKAEKFEELDYLPEYGLKGTYRAEKESGRELVVEREKLADGMEEKLMRESQNRQNRRVITTGGYYSYLKIAEGCNKHCTYCIIPKVRGSYRSVPMEDLIEEAEYLAKQGVKELILVAQETTVYGVDLYGRKMLPELLRRLCRIRGLYWIRILYCYPEEITNELIQVMKEEEKICHYLDLPIQHASDTVLKRMGRRTSRQELVDIVERLRREIPDIAIRTTLITGFPGETEEQHEELKQFIRNMRFERLGVFTYSPEEHTPAAEMADQIEEETKEARRDELMALQQEIAFEHAENMQGRTLYAMVEGKLPDEPVYIARTYQDAPGIDGYLFVECPYEIISGDFMKVKVTGAQGYDLIGELVVEYE